MPNSMDNYHIEMRPYRIIGGDWLVFCLFGLSAAFLSQLYWRIWDGAMKEEAFAFVVKQLKARNIPPKPSRSAAYKIMKNTRVNH